MKFTIRKKIALIFLSSIVLVTVFLKFIDFDLLPISQKNDDFNRLLFLGTYSILFTILVIILIEKRIDFFTIFHFMWIFPITLLISNFIISNYDIEKLDYLFSRKIENFTNKKYVDESGWTINEFTLKNEIFYFSQNPSWGEIYNGDFKIYKSFFSNRYFLLKQKE